MEVPKIPTPLKLEGNMADNFRIFKQMFETYLRAVKKSNEEDEIKLALFFGFIGKIGLDIFKKLRISDENKNKYNKVIEEFEQVLSGAKKNVPYNRFLFYSRDQTEEESVFNYVDEVIKLLNDCEFDSFCPEDILKIKIIYGTRDKTIKRKLMNENIMSNMQEILGLINEYEDADSDRDVKSNDDNEDVGAIEVTSNVGVQTGKKPSQQMYSAQTQFLQLQPMYIPTVNLSYHRQQDQPISTQMFTSTQPKSMNCLSNTHSNIQVLREIPLDNLSRVFIDPPVENRWSPTNPNGVKMYDKGFLMSLRYVPASREKPNILKLMLDDDKTSTLNNTGKTDIMTLPTLFITRNHVEFIRNEKLAEIEACSNPQLKKQLQFHLEEYDRKLQMTSVGNIAFLGKIFMEGMLSNTITMKLLTNLANTKDKDNLECLCKFLKIIGKELEIIRYVDLSPIFRTIKNLIDKKEVNGPIKMMLQSMLDLRNANWEPKKIHPSQKEEDIDQTIQLRKTAASLMTRKNNRVRPKSLDIIDSSRNRINQFSVQSDKLKVVKPLIDEPLGSSLLFSNWGKGTVSNNPRTRPIDSSASSSQQTTLLPIKLPTAIKPAELTIFELSEDSSTDES